MVLPNTHTQRRAWPRLSAGVSQHSPHSSDVPGALSQPGHGSLSHSQGTAWSQAGRGATQRAIDHTDRCDCSAVCLMHGRLGHGALSAHWGIITEPDRAGKPCARESQQCCKSSKKDTTERLLLLIFFTLLSPGEDLAFVRSPGYSFQAGAEP